jgi:hypothetical protein
MSEFDYQPVILIGAARSGTKLIRNTIANHPDVSKIPYDINYIWRYDNEKLPHDEIPSDLLTEKSASKIRAYFEQSRNSKQVLIEKTVSNCLRIPYVHRVFPQAKYIQLIRDGWDVVESSYRQWIAPPDWRYILRKMRAYPLLDAFGYANGYGQNLLRKLLFPHNGKTSTWGPRYNGIEEDVRSKQLIEVCAIQWGYCVTRAYQDLAKLPADSVYTIQYEEFVNHPSAVLTGIADFLEIDSDPYLSSQQLGISTGNIGKGRRGLSPEQCNQIRDYIAQTQGFVNAGLSSANKIVSQDSLISTI